MSSFQPSDKEFEAALARYFQTCSEAGLGTLFLSCLNENDRLQKEIARLIDKAIKNMGAVWAAEFLRDHPELRHPQAPPLSELITEVQAQTQTPKKAPTEAANTKTA